MCGDQPLGQSPGGEQPMIRRRSVTERWFSPMQAGSLRSGLLVLTTTALGAGVLTLPFAFKELGWTLGIFCAAMLGCLNVMSLELLLDAGMSVGATSYGQLMTLVGGPWAASFLDSTVSLITWGAMVAYFIFIKQLLPGLLERTGVPHEIARAEVVLPIIAFFCFLISLPRDITIIGKFSVLGVVSVVYLSGLLIHSSQTVGVGLVTLPEVVGPGNGGNVAQTVNAVSLMIAGFLCQYNVFFVFSDVSQPTVRRLRKITRLSTLFQTICYLTLGLCGFATFGTAVTDNVYTNFSTLNAGANCGRLLICISLCVSIPLQTFGARANLIALISRHLPEDVEEEENQEAVMTPLKSLQAAYKRGFDKMDPADFLGVHQDGVHCEGMLNHTPPLTPTKSGLTDISDPGRKAPRVKPQSLDEPLLAAEAGKAMSPKTPKGAKASRKGAQALHVGTTAFLISFCLLLSFVVPSISYLLGKLGGICGVTQMYLMPSIVLYKRPSLRTPLQRVVIFTGFSIASVFGLVAVTGLGA